MISLQCKYRVLRRIPLETDILIGCFKDGMSIDTNLILGSLFFFLSIIKKRIIVGGLLWYVLSREDAESQKTVVFKSIYDLREYKDIRKGLQQKRLHRTAMLEGAGRAPVILSYVLEWGSFLLTAFGRMYSEKCALFLH